jgi:hypothetical protein
VSSVPLDSLVGLPPQMLTDKDLIVVQFRSKGEEVVFPPEKAGGVIVYPVSR